MMMKPGYQPITRREITRHVKRGGRVPQNNALQHVRQFRHRLYERLMNRPPGDNNGPDELRLYRDNNSEPFLRLEL